MMVTSYSSSIDPDIVSVTIFFKYLRCNFNDLEQGLFKVIQGCRDQDETETTRSNFETRPRQDVCRSRDVTETLK